jgi:hypothetical protein
MPVILHCSAVSRLMKVSTKRARLFGCEGVIDEPFDTDEVALGKLILRFQWAEAGRRCRVKILGDTVRKD